MSRYEVDPLLAVGLEGTFGLFTTAVAMPILHFFVRCNSKSASQLPICLDCIRS